MSVPKTQRGEGQLVVITKAEELAEYTVKICKNEKHFSVRKISNGTKCQLRSEMLRIYYHNRERGVIRQYEYENFVMLYEAYKALKGNSFIDKIYEEVRSWEIVT